MEGTKRRGKDAQKAIVKACKRYIETHLDEDITNDILAENMIFLPGPCGGISRISAIIPYLNTSACVRFIWRLVGCGMENP